MNNYLKSLEFKTRALLKTNSFKLISIYCNSIIFSKILKSNYDI